MAGCALTPGCQLPVLGETCSTGGGVPCPLALASSGLVGDAPGVHLARGVHGVGRGSRTPVGTVRFLALLQAA